MASSFVSLFGKMMNITPALNFGTAVVESVRQGIHVVQVVNAATDEVLLPPTRLKRGEKSPPFLVGEFKEWKANTFIRDILEAAQGKPFQPFLLRVDVWFVMSSADAPIRAFAGPPVPDVQHLLTAGERGDYALSYYTVLADA